VDADPVQVSVDPYLVATKLARDATVAYHAALQFWGKAYSQWQRFHYTTETSTRGFRFRQIEFRPVRTPRALRDSGDVSVGVTEERHAGGRVRVTTLERTLVDVLDVPTIAGGWEEIWRSLEMVEFFDLDVVLSYVLKLGSALTIARLGFFLEQHREQLMVAEAHLESLREHRPRQPRYLDARREPGRLVTRWNLIVPEWILERSWAEVA
jgi:predicted transcriptional regulator of viral defense system